MKEIMIVALLSKAGVGKTTIANQREKFVPVPWNSDGTKLYTRTTPTSELREFEVTTPWDQSTKVITSILYTVPEYKDWQFLPDDNRVIGVVGNELREYKRL